MVYQDDVHLVNNIIGFWLDVETKWHKYIHYGGKEISKTTNFMRCNETEAKKSLLQKVNISSENFT